MENLEAGVPVSVLDDVVSVDGAAVGVGNDVAEKLARLRSVTTVRHDCTHSYSLNHKCTQTLQFLGIPLPLTWPFPLHTYPGIPGNGHVLIPIAAYNRELEGVRSTAAALLNEVTRILSGVKETLTVRVEDVKAAPHVKESCKAKKKCSGRYKSFRSRSR